MKNADRCILWAMLFGQILLLSSARADVPVKRVLVVVEGATTLRNVAMGDGRQLATLLGHFATETRVIGAHEYVSGEIERYDITFSIGFHRRYDVPRALAEDLLRTERPVVWMNTGFREISENPEIAKRFGFTVRGLDTVSTFTSVQSGSRIFDKGEPNLNQIEITDRKKVSVLATARSSKTGTDRPYIVRSGNLVYIGDSPFASAGEEDRYLLFADMLHDLLGEDHEESHSAILRIEDVNPLDDPDRLREIADILSARGIPFLVGVSPFYVNPGEGMRVSLSDKPDLADALRYMVRNGGTIVMHGVTHQYKGVTGSDYEFWDAERNGPIPDESVEGISRKIEMGIQEFMRNGLYPLIWETPHYTASFRLYETIARYFSTAMEQRLSIEDIDYSQYFPYLIHRDLFGQTIYPENLGFVPLDPDMDRSRASVQALISHARKNLYVRDGFAACFFHAFLDPSLLEELVDGIRSLGYEYIDLRERPNWVHTRDRVILTGAQQYSVTLEAQYLSETWFNPAGEIERTLVSPSRISGRVTKTVSLSPGEFFKAEPVEFREREKTVVESITEGAGQIFQRVFGSEESWQEARPVILWNHHSRGAAYNDQASFASVFRSINLPLDTLFVGQRLDLTSYNLVIVPFAFIDSLGLEDFGTLTRFVEEGGNLITDAPNSLIENFGVSFSNSRVRVSRVRDRLFPDERIHWTNFELLNKFDATDVDRVFCIDEVTEAPLVIGKRWHSGKVLFFGTRFDPSTQIGTSRYPFLLEYVRSYFHLGPIVRRENLEVYFDPGFRRTISTESLVKQWVRQGIRIIHVAGWHQYLKYTYDYERLVRLAHANGILVYAWLEPPQVSQKFWLEHPSWREKNYQGEDVRPSWRYPVALTDRECLAAMTTEYRLFLQQYDWDGVNLAELYFEAGKGLADPRMFTPMHPSARSEFRRRYGYDPSEVFSVRSSHFWSTDSSAVSAITEYRVASLARVYDTLLTMIGEIRRKKPGFDVVLTAMDELGSPELRIQHGVDIPGILALQRRYGFLLQVEDPERLWSSDPRRYTEIGMRYEKLLGDRTKLLLDLNILSFRRPDDVTPFPTLIQTGTESFDLVRSASLGAPRVTIYAESSINPQDMMFLPYAAASEVLYRPTEKGYRITTPYSVSIRLPPQYSAIQLDGKLLSPSRDNLFCIPAGEHEIVLGPDPAGAFSTHTLDTHILSMTGNILSVEYGLRDINVRYSSTTRALMSLNRYPTRVRVDGADTTCAVMKGNDCYSVFLPSGDHLVEIAAGDVFTYGVNLTSLWSTTAIALFGLAAVLLLFLMYVSLKIMRRRIIATGGSA